MPGESLQAMLARVRAALGPRCDGAITPPKIDAGVVRQGDAADRIACFVERAAATGMQVHRTTPTAVGELVVELLRVCGARSIITDQPDLRPIVQAAEIAAVDWMAEPIPEQFAVDAGVSGVWLAVAETGSLVCASSARHGRGLSLVPPMHIAIVRPDQIVDDLADVWPRLDPSAMPSSLSFITGPSKTADIEGVLITGVHGPGIVHVIIPT